MSAWIPIFTGLLAFVGVIVGQVVASDFNTAAKRREVRRSQIERFADFLSEDVTWMLQHQTKLLVGEGARYDTAPFDRAIGVFFLYFGRERNLLDKIEALRKARFNHLQLLVDAFGRRVELAATNEHPVAATRLPRADEDAVVGRYSAYLTEIYGALRAASEIAEETIPQESQLKKWCADAFDKIAIWRRVG